MIIDTGVTIAYKCSSCGAFEFFNLSLFELAHTKELYLPCHCKKSGITIYGESTNSFSIKVSCISCGKEHMYSATRKNMLNSGPSVFYCPETGMQICFIGNDQEVSTKIDCLEKELDELINMFGYDNYFVNTRVMFDALNKIHDIAEQGNLYCKCGNRDIELVLLSDRVELKCRSCSACVAIHAATNEDLREILLMQKILLKGNTSRDLVF